MRLPLRLISAFCVALSLLTAPAMAQIERVELDSSAFSLGTLRTVEEGAFPSTLWADTERHSLEDLLILVPTRYDEPLHLELLRRVLLSPGNGPARSDNKLAGQKLMKAAEAGFYKDAASLAAFAPSTNTEPALARVIAYQEMMDGQVNTACARGEALREGRAAPFWIKLRLICYVRAGESSAAELTLNLLRRQDTLTADELARFVAFADGEVVALPKGQISVFDWVMALERGMAADESILDRASPGLLAAIARSEGLPTNMRETALLSALSLRTIDINEAVQLLDRLGTSQLATDYVTVTSQAPGSLEHSEALGTALRRGGTDYRQFEARALMFKAQVEAAMPVMNYAPNATEIALAAMINGNRNAVEAWISALSADQTLPTGVERARQLVDVYSLIDPQAAERAGAFIGMAGQSSIPMQTIAYNADPNVPITTLVAAALPAAEAGSIGPATLLYLAGMATVEDRPGGIRETIVTWARDRTDLEWIDRQIAFRAQVVAVLEAPLSPPVTN